MNIEETTKAPASTLSFDIQNPRLTEFNLSETSTDEDIIQILWDAMDVNEIVLSIAASGFFQHEPLIVANENGKHIVIEGNRRLAAVNLLTNPEFAKSIRAVIPRLNAQQLSALDELPVVFSTRQNAWRYLGFKHVNGPAKWSSYAKSKYIADVHRDFGINLSDIARQIGDTHRTVQRLYRGLMVIEQAEELQVFNREDRWRGHFSFSHLYTGLEYPGISEFIDLRPAKAELAEPVPAEKKEELGELCRWLYGSKRDDTEPIVRSQNPHLRQLDRVLRSTEAVAALRAGNDLSLAFELSRPPVTVFQESLIASKRSLEKVRGLLSTGYDGSEKLLRIAGDIADLAYDLYDEMERNRERRRRKRERVSD